MSSPNKKKPTRTPPPKKKTKQTNHAIQTVCFGCLLISFTWTWETAGGREKFKRLHHVKVWTAASMSAGEDARWRLSETCIARMPACAEWLLRAARAAKHFITLTDSQQTCLTVCCLCFTLRSLRLSLRAVYFFFHLFLFLQVNIFCVRLGTKKKEFILTKVRVHKGLPLLRVIMFDWWVGLWSRCRQHLREVQPGSRNKLAYRTKGWLVCGLFAT